MTQSEFEQYVDTISNLCDDLRFAALDRESGEFVQKAVLKLKEAKSLLGAARNATILAEQ